MIISNSIKYVGVNDHKIDFFEGQYNVPNGISYNSYVIIDEKIAVIDTVDVNFTHEWLDNLANALGNRKPDYLVVLHMEPDHSANIINFLKMYPDVKIVASKKAFMMMNNFFDRDFKDEELIVGEGDKLTLGTHTLTFVTAPMVHWPEVIVAYEEAEKVLFSADAFGKFGALDITDNWVDEARRYYIGIVGKYGAQVQALLKKASQLDIKKICPLHGPVLYENLEYYINLYDKWSKYEAEVEGVLVLYTSIYGNTKKAVMALKENLKSMNAPEVVVKDLARSDIHEVVSLAFKYPKIVLATTTYNSSIFPHMRELINHLTERNFQNKTIGLIENGSWAPLAIKVMKEMLSSSKNITFLETSVTINSGLNSNNLEQLSNMAKELCSEYMIESDLKAPNNYKALFNIGYGLYVVTCNDGKKDNGLIVNTVTQITSNPNRVAVTINKENYSHYIIKQTGKMNVNCLTIDAPFKIFETFGFQSGRNVDKFIEYVPHHSKNGLAILPKFINSFMSLEVEKYIDMDTHGMFICTVTEAKVVSNRPTMTYDYYHENVKPKPSVEGVKGYVCKICGWVYEGEPLPSDIVCPLCKHGAADFEKIE